jgi:hypothetical protein
MGKKTMINLQPTGADGLRSQLAKEEQLARSCQKLLDLRQQGRSKEGRESFDTQDRWNLPMPHDLCHNHKFSDDKVQEILTRYNNATLQGMINTYAPRIDNTKRLLKMMKSPDSGRTTASHPNNITRSNTQKTQSADHPKISTPHPKISTPPTSLLQAVDTILKAFNKGVKISNSALEALKHLTPETLRKKGPEQLPVGEKPPAALPAPEPKIDLGLDRTDTEDPAAIRRDQS